jgi:LysR family transcriptional regulator, carnitine catabolism transcriptional activator
VADLRSLTVLAAVVRHRSFTQAARELHVAQQAVSRTVARLEAELGVALVERTTHRAEPTAAGAALAEDAESLVAAADAAVARARELGGAPPQTLALGMSPGLSQGEVERILDALGAALPGVQLDLVESRPAAVESQLRDGTADLVLSRYAQPGPGRHVLPLGETAGGLAVPRGHRFARRRKLRLADLGGERVLIWSQRSAGTRALQALLAGVDVEWTVSTVVGRDGLADVARGAALAVWAVDDKPYRDVALIPLEPPLALPVVAVLRHGTPPLTIRRALDAIRAALA